MAQTRNLAAIAKRWRKFTIHLLLFTLVFSLTISTVIAKEPLATPSIQSSSNRSDLLQQGVNLYREGKFSEALFTWEQAAKASQQVGDQQGFIRSVIYQGQVLRDLGKYRRSGEKLESLVNPLEKLPDSPLKAQGWLHLGEIRLLAGDITKAEEAFNKSLQIAQGLKSPQDIAAAKLSLGNLRRSQLSQQPIDQRNPSRHQDAINLYRDAAEKATSAITKIRAQLNQLQLLLDIGNLPEARDLATQIPSEIAKLPPSRAAVEARINLADSLLLLAEKDPKDPQLYNDAAKLLAVAIADAKRLGDGRAQSHALGTLGKVYEKTQQLAEAERVTKQALLLAQANNAPEIAYRWQWQLGRLIASKKTRTPIDSQAAIAAYTLALENLQSIRGDLVAANRDVQFSFRDSVEPVYRELVDLLTSENATEENLKQARRVIESRQLAELDNFFREACLGGREVQIDEIDSQAAVIYPIILPERLEVIVSLPGQKTKQKQTESELKRYTTKGLPQKDIESLLTKLRVNVAGERGGVGAEPRDPNNPLPTREQLLQNTQKDAQQVYNWLIRPVEAELQTRGVKTLVFVLDGPLLNLPMAALHDGKQYLVEKYAIALAPGLQLVDPKRLVRGQITAFLGGLSEQTEKFPQFDPLPNVPQELQDIRALVPNSKELLNQQFQKAEVQKEINTADFRVVHLATHGQFSSDPAQTFILTWNESININELKDLLRKRELNAPSAIELLVLSACQTAKGDPRAALGLAGVALRAGARSTLATLWSVNDPATATLMAEFYRQLSNNPDITKAESLRRAQQKLLKDIKYNHPYYWGAFVLVGNWL